MSSTSSDITIECEPINVSGEIEIEKVNKISIHPSLNRKVSNNKKTDKEKTSMVIGLLFLTFSIPFLVITIDYIYKSIFLNISISSLPPVFNYFTPVNFAIGNAIICGILLLMAGLGLGKVFK